MLYLILRYYIPNYVSQIIDEKNIYIFVKNLGLRIETKNFQSKSCQICIMKTFFSDWIKKSKNQRSTYLNLQRYAETCVYEYICRLRYVYSIFSARFSGYVICLPMFLRFLCYFLFFLKDFSKTVPLRVSSFHQKIVHESKIL